MLCGACGFAEEASGRLDGDGSGGGILLESLSFGRGVWVDVSAFERDAEALGGLIYAGGGASGAGRPGVLDALMAFSSSIGPAECGFFKFAAGLSEVPVFETRTVFQGNLYGGGGVDGGCDKLLESISFRV